MRSLRWNLAGFLNRRSRWLAAVGAVCVLLGAASYVAWSSWETDQDRRKARQALDQRDFEQAQTYWRAYLERRPNDPEGHFLLARACRRARVEDFSQARRHLDEAQHLGWSRPEVALESALLAFQEDGSAGEEESLLRHALETAGPEKPLVAEALARGCLQANRLEAANGWLNTWVEETPRDWYPHLWRGALFEYLNKANLAVPDYQLVLEKKPGDEEIRRRLGLMFLQSGYDYDGAWTQLELYQRRHPDDPDTLVGMARCRRWKQQPEAARALLDRVVAAHPDHFDALLTLALLDLDAGHGLQALDRLRRLEPLAWQDHEEEDLARLRRLEPTPNHEDITHRTRTVLTLLASVLGRLGRADEARRYQEKVEQIAADAEELQKALRQQEERPHDPDLRNRIGVLSRRLGIKKKG
ncbi:MAG: hypothetical protein JO112_04780 [Planctomycetes bacterium]|nr:hypothetical protein [Planctomycetota bacterium]